MTDFSDYLIVSDMDGTFLDKDSKAVPANLQALERFRAGGGLFTLASGRVHSVIKPCFDRIEEVVNVPVVACNGTYLYDFKANVPYFEERLPQPLVLELVEFLKKEFPQIPLRACAFEGVYYHILSESSKKLLMMSAPEARHILPLEEWPTDTWYKLLLVIENEDAASIREKFRQRFGERFCYTTASATTLELMPPAISKATGLEKLRRLSKKTKGRILVACGDFENDIEMLQAADIAVCPANACDEVKKIADFVLCDHNEGLIADVVAKIESGELKMKKKRDTV